jgi:2-isopropylmalate synthase
VLAEVKELELQGWTFDAADASFELLLRKHLDRRRDYFDVESWRVITDARERRRSHLRGDRQAHRGGSATWPPARATARSTPSTTRCGWRSRCLPRAGHKLELVDFRVRILDASHGTDAITRVLIETSDGTTTWQTVGVAPNIVEASWRALVDGITYGLTRQGVPAR